ncbi:glutamate racemase [Shewanella gaetbuli]|uniref:Glutamate racemase n=1 Tax=Shewanella gaetbuli TaxID=220752 RepID=A0A9X1ZM81_9GAMM|nr:glutamate racemase [Shewanella gaetbuli]MCL1144191.1 glutamate racemase [Shewanella gaetbuli]
MTGPILVFDSGIGGLSVLTEIRKQLPNNHYHYLFDNARMPYGNLSEHELVTGCVELIMQQADVIKPSVIVVACNTASTLVLPKLRQRLSVPIVGVVPAIKPAAAKSINKHIGLLATPGTVARDYTQVLINNFANDCTVELFGSSELVLMAEEYIASGEIDLGKLEKVLRPITLTDIDVLVLGCTHFPIIAQHISSIIGKNVQLLDSGEAIANRVSSLITKEEYLNSKLDVSFTKKIAEGLNKALVDYGFTTMKLITD